MLYGAIEQLLNEFFVNVHEDNVSFSLGDLFEPSHFLLTDVFIRPNLINSLYLPFEIVGGYIGDAKVEGLVGAVAGSPLTLLVDNVCLVLRQKQINRDNELMLRYSKELLVTLWQSFFTPSFEGKDKKKGSRSFISPAKWIASKFQAAVADMTVKLEHIHIRFESEFNGSFIAYGLYIPTIHFHTREIEEQILVRRQQPGVVYPTASDSTTSKLMTLENVSLYCDLHTESYWKGSGSDESSAKIQQSFDFFRTNALKPLHPDPKRDIFFASIVWIKLDLCREKSTIENVTGGIKLAAMDIVTEALKMHLDVTQLTALKDEISHLTSFTKLTQVQQWRPSCIDRECLVPPTVKVSSTSLLPLCEDDKLTFMCSANMQRKSREWFRGMWQYAIRCVLFNLHNGKDYFSRFPWKTRQQLELEKAEQKRQYIDFYTRSLSEEALLIILRGRRLLVLPKSPRRIAEEEAEDQSYILPAASPLTIQEQWQYSDLIEKLSIYDQRVCRAMAEHALQKQFGKTGSQQSPHRRAHSMIEITSGPPSSIANRSPSPVHHFPLTRGATEPAVLQKHHQTSLAIPSFAKLHTATFSNLSIPTTNETDSSKSGLRSPLISPRSSHAWLQGTFLPSWMVKKAVPYINWNFGTISLYLHKSIKPMSSSPRAFYGVLKPGNLRRIDSTEQSIDDNTQRNQHDLFLELGFESCKGSVLVCKSSLISFLVELRLGLFHATLFNQSPLESTPHSCGWSNSISSEYIREPNDGFLYVGLKYNSKEPSQSGSSSPHKMTDTEWNLKGKICIGPLIINCNELALRSALLGTNAQYSGLFKNASKLLSTHFAIIREVYHSWVDLLYCYQRKKFRFSHDEEVDTHSPTHMATRFFTIATKRREQECKQIIQQARLEKLLNTVFLYSTTFELDLGSLELHLSLLTSHVEKILGMEDQHALHCDLIDQIDVELPPVHFGLQNRPSLNECNIDAGGTHVQYRSSKRGRDAVIQYIKRHFSKKTTNV